MTTEQPVTMKWLEHIHETVWPGHTEAGKTRWMRRWQELAGVGAIEAEADWMLFLQSAVIYNEEKAEKQARLDWETDAERRRKSGIPSNPDDDGPGEVMA